MDLLEPAESRQPTVAAKLAVLAFKVKFSFTASCRCVDEIYRWMFMW
jgi:hypothetical protein